jgi:replicative superfamily II helicase
MAELRRSKFKTDLAVDPVPSDPESLFRDLKSRSPEIPYLWSHQADLLRAYDKAHQETADVAFELPTGAGKTLIGQLLGEYRRRKKGERVVYLCPTRQLALQAFDHAKEYGLNAYLLLRPDYPNINEYRLGTGIGITTYSTIFNANPRIADAETIVLDDAHAAEDYILGPWSVSVT